MTFLLLLTAGRFSWNFSLNHFSCWMHLCTIIFKFDSNNSREICPLQFYHMINKTLFFHAFLLLNVVRVVHSFQNSAFYGWYSQKKSIFHRLYISCETRLLIGMPHSLFCYMRLYVTLSSTLLTLPNFFRLRKTIDCEAFELSAIF